MFAAMRCLLLVILLGSAFPLFGQADSIRRSDTIVVERKYAILPGMAVQSSAQTSYAILDASLNETAKPGLGISVLNTARGQVPGMYIDPYYRVDTLTWRKYSPLLVVDGIVFNQNIDRYYNMNAFEYEEMHMVLGRNGTIPYGGAGNRGALVLNSRTGEGYSKPALDFNTYTTYAWGSDQVSTSMWQLSNSLAYSQDFGKVDLRVSGNYTAHPPGNGTPYSPDAPDYLRFRINTGFIHDRFRARLILNGNTGSLKSSYSNTYTFPGQSPTVVDRSNENTSDMLQANLVLSYALADWLTISTQASRMITNEVNQTQNGSLAQKVLTDNQHDAGNILLNINKRLSPSFQITGTLGLLANHQSSKKTGYSNYLGYNNSLWREAKAATNSILYTTEIGFRDKLFAGINLRRDFVDLYYANNAYNAYSFYGGYNFHQLIDKSAKILSLAKVRLSHGYNDNRVNYTDLISTNSTGAFSSTLPTSSLEIGTDLSILKGRVHFMGNFFQNKTFNPPAPAPPIDPATGYTYTYLNLPFNSTLTTNGFEFLVRVKVLEKKGFSLTTQFVAGWNKLSTEEYQTSYAPSLLTSGSIIYPGPIPTGSVVLSNSFGSPLPDWTGGWLNRVTVGRFSASVLIDVSVGGEMYVSPTPSASLGRDLGNISVTRPDSTISASDYFNHMSNSYPNTTLEDKTYIKLRDVSVGYNFSLSSRLKGMICLSFRNLVMLYSKSKYDPEIDALSGAALNKSVSVNFSLQF